MKVRPVVVVGCVTGALLLGGCSVHPGAAAVVGDRTISQAYLERTRDDVAPLVTSADMGQVLSALIVAPYVIEAAADNGVGVSADDARAYMVDSAASAGIDPAPTFGDGSVEVFRMVLADQNLQGLPDAADIYTEVNAQVSALDVDVNPRYGREDPQTGQITPLQLPWIVQPAEAG